MRLHTARTREGPVVRGGQGRLPGLRWREVGPRGWDSTTRDQQGPVRAGSEGDARHRRHRDAALSRDVKRLAVYLWICRGLPGLPGVRRAACEHPARIDPRRGHASRLAGCATSNIPELRAQSPQGALLRRGGLRTRSPLPEIPACSGTVAEDRRSGGAVAPPHG